MATQSSESRPVARATNRADDTSPFALGLLLRRAQAKAATAFLEALRPLDLELRHFAVMILLAERRSMSQRELAGASGIDKTMVTRSIDDLERLGLVRRCAVPGDRRVNAIELTPKGLEVFDAAHEGANDIARNLVAHMKPGEAEALISLLSRFVYPEGEEG